MDAKKYLNRLVGKILTSTGIGTNTIVPMDVKDEGLSDARLTIVNLLYFEDYCLHVYNPISIVPSDKELTELVGCKVIGSDERTEEAELSFNNGYKLLINMRDEVYYDPESMCLYGPNHFWVAWN